MKSILSILTAVVLLSSSFTFSSCKSCDKRKTKPAGRDDDINNTPLDTSTSNATPDGGSSATSTAGGKSDGTGVPALVFLENEIKAVKGLVLKVREARDRANVVMSETIYAARMGSSVTAQEKLKVLIVASGDVQVEALNVENKVKELNIGINPVAIALIAQSDWMAAHAAVWIHNGQYEVNHGYSDKKEESELLDEVLDGDKPEGNLQGAFFVLRMKLSAAAAQAKVEGDLDEDDVKAIVAILEAIGKAGSERKHRSELERKMNEAIAVAQAADPSLAKYLN